MIADAGSAAAMRTKGTDTLKLWRDICKLAGRVWELEPWTFMDETDLFGVEEPVSKQLGFVSVMGTLGEHRAVAVYQGTKGLHDFLALETASGDLPSSRWLDIPQVQLSFGERSRLQPEDLKVFKRLGVTVADGDAWPMVRTYRPSCVPWFAEVDELRLLRVALLQLLTLASRIEADPTCLCPPEGSGILVRSIGGAGDAWGETYVTIAAPEPDRITVRIDPDVIEDVLDLPNSDRVLEVDCFRTEHGMAEPGQRPHFPYALLICDAESGAIVHTSLIDPTPSLNGMWATVPELVTLEISKLAVLPREIRVQDRLLAQLLDLIAPGFGFTIARARRLPALERAKAELLRNLASRAKRKTGRKPKKR